MKDHSLSQMVQKTSKVTTPNRIDQLCKEFQDLKGRIRSHSSRSKQMSRASIVQPTTQTNIFEDLHQDYFPKRNSMIDQYSKPFFHQRSSLMAKKEISKTYLKKQDSASEQNMKDVIKTFQDSFMREMETTFYKKMDSLESKLRICQEFIRNIASLVKIKKSFRKYLADSRKTSSKAVQMDQQNTSSESVTQLIQHYEQKLAAVTKKYEEKLRKIERNSNRETSSTAKTSLQRDINDFQTLLLAKDHQIGVLKLQNSKLRRINDKNMIKIDQNQKTIDALYKKLTSLTKNSIQKIDFFVQTEDYHLSSQKILLDEPKSCQNIGHSMKDLNCSIQDDVHEDLQAETAELYNSQNFESTRKREGLQTMKNLLLEIDLISQQNKNLYAKKHFLQSQNHNSEKEEQFFQQQSSIYKAEIRYLSSNLKILDELSVALLNKSHIKIQKVEELSNDVKSKQLFKEKCKNLA